MTRHPPTQVGFTRTVLAALGTLVLLTLGTFALVGRARADDTAGQTTFFGPLSDGGAVGLTMPRGVTPARLVVIIPDGPADLRQNAPYVDALIQRGAAVAEVGIGDDPVPPLADLFRAVAAIPGLGRAEVALLGLGTGGRFALAEGRGRRAALYPGCAGMDPGPAGDALLVHGRLSSDAAACEDMARARPWLVVLGVEAGYGWDIPAHREDDVTRVPHPAGGRAEARMHADVTLAVAEAVADFLAGPMTEDGAP